MAKGRDVKRAKVQYLIIEKKYLGSKQVRNPLVQKL